MEYEWNIMLFLELLEKYETIMVVYQGYNRISLNIDGILVRQDPMVCPQGQNGVQNMLSFDMLKTNPKPETLKP